MEGLIIKELVSGKEKKERDESRRIIHIEQVKAMLGGEWPKSNGFNFDAVDFYKAEDGMLVPHSDEDDLAPGPSFILFMVDDVSAFKRPVIIIPKELKEYIEFK